jgi:hypothetical protein
VPPVMTASLLAISYMHVLRKPHQMDEDGGLRDRSVLSNPSDIRHLPPQCRMWPAAAIVVVVMMNTTLDGALENWEGINAGKRL